jgi:hypothetical protein
MTDAQTTYDRAASAYDKEHERALTEAITPTIFETSAISDAMVNRTAECAQHSGAPAGRCPRGVAASDALTDRNPHGRRAGPR